MEAKYKIHDIIFTSFSEVIIIQESAYDDVAGNMMYKGIVPATGAERCYLEYQSFNNAKDYEESLLEEVKRKVRSCKEEIESAKKILNDEGHEIHELIKENN